MSNTESLRQLTSEIVWITNRQELELYQREVDSFFRLYKHPSNFPDPNELEEPFYIQQRIHDASPLPHTYLMMCFIRDGFGMNVLAGGCIVEFYPDSACGLVTYLFVDPDWRGIRIGPHQQKIAEILIQGERGLPAMIDFWGIQYKTKVNVVFFETNNPKLTDAEKDSMPPAKRILFFDRVGAKRVSFNYRQPPLGEGKRVVDNLFLMTFPQLTGLTTQVSMQTVMLFIAELARSLDQNKPLGARDTYGEKHYRYDQKILQALYTLPIKDWCKIELKGFVADGKNIIQETFCDLLNNAPTGQLALVSALA